MNQSFSELTEKIGQMIGLGESYDAGLREIRVFAKRVNLYFLTGLVDSLQVIEIVKGLLKIPRDKDYSFQLIEENLAHHSLAILTKFDDIILNILNGMVVLVLEDCDSSISIDVRNYPSRAIAEPDMEKVIRGPHDGFNENFHTNIQLVRRRIKDPRLRNELHLIGEQSPSYVCLTYLKGVCDEKLLEEVRKRLKSIHTEHLIMTDKALEEMLVREKGLNPYPLVRYTERADTVAVHLYQGMFSLFVDTSPSVILAPTTYFDHTMHFEEYRQTPAAGTYLRHIRFLGILISIFMTPIWLILLKNNALWGIFRLLAPSSDVKTNVYIQVLVAELGVEFLRLASIHTPTSLSTSMSLIAGILIGNIAVTVGLFSIQTILVVAVSAIGTYLTPSYELGLANKITKMLFILAIIAFNWYGFAILVILWILYLTRMKSFGKPYLYPLIPFDGKMMIKVLFRLPLSKKGMKAKE